MEEVYTTECGDGLSASPFLTTNLALSDNGFQLLMTLMLVVVVVGVGAHGPHCIVILIFMFVLLFS